MSVIHHRTLLIPGIGNSEPEHWQSLWEMRDHSCQRLQPGDWDRPVRSDWCAALEEAVSRMERNAVLVAHSLGCLAVVHWANSTNLEIGGALLVAVPDPDSSVFPKDAIGFSPVPLLPLKFPSIVVASTNDRYGTIRYTSRLADLWGSRLVNIGPAGHIGSESGLGDWPFGFALLQDLQRQAK